MLFLTIQVDKPSTPGTEPPRRLLITGSDFLVIDRKQDQLSLYHMTISFWG